MEVLMIVLITITVTLLQTLIQKKLMDVDLVKALKTEMKKTNQAMKTVSKEMKNTKEGEAPNTKKLNELMSKSVGIQKKMMGQTMKPMMISSLVVFVAFYIIPMFFSGAVLNLPFSIPFIGNQLGWLGIFILTSIISGLIFRKVFDVGM
ncbi:MAG: DUF106 domain-containing protein [Candidatus Aenigmarchaeota archaeon]|nr:DUF106 domain-containing protein [Candidatus Aenigmarchaeota archaeon]